MDWSSGNNGVTPYRTRRIVHAGNINDHLFGWCGYVLQDIQELVKTKFQPTWEWVEGHAVERKGWSNSTLAERLNHQADILAKEALVSAIAGGSLMEGDFPFKPIRFKLSGARVCSSPRQSLEKDWGYRTARTLCRKGHITKRGLSPCVVGWSR